MTKLEKAKKRRRTAQLKMEKAEATFERAKATFNDAVAEVDALNKGKVKYQGVPLRL